MVQERLFLEIRPGVIDKLACNSVCFNLKQAKRGIKHTATHRQEYFRVEKLQPPVLIHCWVTMHASVLKGVSSACCHLQR